MAFRFVDYPVALMVVSLFLLCGAAFIGTRLRGRREFNSDERNQLNVLAGAALTLVGLIIGFSFAMAVDRYNVRKVDEATEANAIGTEYLRCALLDPNVDARLRTSLKTYLNLRIDWYDAPNSNRAQAVLIRQRATEQMMWGLVSRSAAKKQTAINALVAAGMNAVIDNAGYSQAAWANQIPAAAWLLMMTTAIFASGLLGYATRWTSKGIRATYAIPILVSVAFLLIADLDSARHGLITLRPENLIALQAQLQVNP